MSCNKINWGRNGKCFACKTKKPHDLLNGDWFCYHCDAYMFAKKERCRKCKRMKKGDICDTLAESEEEACVVCVTNKRSCSVVHGNDAHFIMCMACAYKVDDCPLCRKTIVMRIKTYL